MKRILLILVLLQPIAIWPLSPFSHFALSPVSTVSAATLTPQQKAAKKRAAAKQKAAKKKAAEKKKAAKQKAAAKKKAAKQKAKQQAAKQKAKQQTAKSAPRQTDSPTHQLTNSPHNLIAWGDVGYSALFSTLDQHQTKGGIGAGVGIGYEFERNRWLALVGAEFTYLNSTMTMPDYSLQLPYIYTPATTVMTYTHDYGHIRYFDQVGLVQIPLRVGYRFTDHWYGLLGVDLGVGVFGNCRYSYQDYVSARDEQFAEDFHHIGHGTGSNESVDNTTYSLGYTLSPAVEVGYQFNDHVRLGLFAEYGFGLSEKAGPALIHSDMLIGARVTARLNLPKRVKPEPEVEPEPEPQPQPQPEPEPQPQPEPELEPEPEPQPIVLENLLFVFNQAKIIPESTESLDQLLARLQNNPDMVIQIIGHTDAMGSNAYNQRLSEQRAKAVRDYLVQHGIESYRLQYEGRGATEPIDTNDTEEGRQRNRRVEFVVL